MDDFILQFRVYERLVLTSLIVLIGVTSLVVFAIRGTKLEIETDNKLTGRVVLTLAMPVVVLALLVGFTWINFSNPISLTTSGKSVAPAATEGAPERPGARPDDPAPSGTTERIFVGLGGRDGQVALYFQSLFQSAATELGTLSLAMSEAERALDLAYKLAAIRAKREFEPELFRGTLNYTEIERLIEDAFDAL